jgi:hypothetical protein
MRWNKNGFLSYWRERAGIYAWELIKPLQCSYEFDNGLSAGANFRRAIMANYRSIRSSLSEPGKTQRILCRMWFKWVVEIIEKVTEKCAKKTTHIDVVIPLAEKDIAMAKKVIESIRKYVRPTARNVYIVGQDSGSIRNLCDNLECIYIDESKLSFLNREAVKYSVKGIDRTGWLFQQLIKLSVDKISSSEYVFVCDADTMFVKETCLLRGNAVTLFHSDEYNKPYFRSLQKILELKRHACLSFVAHCMLLNCRILVNMREEIERKTGQLWWKGIFESIDKSEVSGFSEYETYGNYLLSRYPSRIRRRYWFNYRLKSINDTYPRWARTVSLHSYSKETLNKPPSA